ncbi:hypothetical protein D3C84_351730 [compost metagenome]
MADQKLPSSTPSQSTPTSLPPKMPIRLNMKASNGMLMTPAQKRGATTRRRGSTAIISRLESCSVAFIRPISAVRAEPARPANSRAVTTGPSSRSRERETKGPRLCSAPKSFSTL